MSDTLKLSIDKRGVAYLTLTRAQKHNAMNADMIEALTQATQKISADSANNSVRACVLQAEGPTFCAGGDLGWMQKQMNETREEKMAGAVNLAQMLVSLDEMPCPLIGKVQGPAYGGGIGMMAVCDIVIGASHAKFALTETKLGLIPATIGPFVIRRIGEAWARQYFFTAKPFDIDTALRMNLVSQSAAGNELDEAVEKEISGILKCQPGAVAKGKALVKTLARNPTMETQNYSAGKLADCWENEEAVNAIAAFFANR